MNFKEFDEHCRSSPRPDDEDVVKRMIRLRSRMWAKENPPKKGLCEITLTPPFRWADEDDAPLHVPSPIPDEPLDPEEEAFWKAWRLDRLGHE